MCQISTNVSATTTRVTRRRRDASTCQEPTHATVYPASTALLEVRLATVTRNLSSHIDLHTRAGGAFDDPVTLTFDLSTSGSHGE